MSKVKTILRYILTIILTLAIIVLVLVNIATSTLLNKNFVLGKLDETAYYVKIYGQIKENFKNYIQQSGLEEEVLNDIITQEQVEKDTQNIITNLYHDINEEVSTEEIKKTKGMLITSEQQKSIDRFIDDICNEYRIGIAHFGFEKSIYSVYEKVNNVVNLANKASLIIIGISLLALIIVSTHRLYKFFAFLGIALFSSGLFFTIVNVYINSKVNIQTITILNDAFSFTLREILQSILDNVQNYGIYLIIPGIVLIIIPNLLHNITKYNQKNKTNFDKKLENSND